MATDDRTPDMALLPAEREMPADAWAEYGGLPPGLRGYCWLLMRQEGDARVRLREAELEVAEWRDRTSRLLSRAEAAEQRAETAEREVEYLRAAMEAREFDRDAEDLYKHAEEAEQSDTPQGRERARRLIAAAEAAEAKANAIMAKVNTASGPLKAKEVSDG